MDPSPTNFFVALAFGTVAIWLNARTQFNRSTYGQSYEFKRLLAKLQPSDVQKGNAYLQSFLLYCVVLTIVYWLICLYIVVQPWLQSFGVAIPGTDFLDGIAGAAKLPEQTGTAIAGVAFDEAGGLLGTVERSGPSPSIPLTVSLAVVGLAPNVPVLYRFEEYLRATAHRLCGIPTQLVDSGLILRRYPLIPKPERSNPAQTGLLLLASDRARIQRYDAAARAAHIGEPESFQSDIAKIVALRRWILRRRIFISGGSSFPEYATIESEITLRVEKLLSDLDAASAGLPKAGADPDKAPQKSFDWPALVLETEQTVADLCLLIALFSQRTDFRRALTEALEAEQNASDEEMAQRQEAVNLLQGGLERASLLTDRGSMGMLVFTRSCGAILVVAALAGFFWGESREAKGNGIYGSLYLAAIYAISATLTYLIPLFFALNYQQERKKIYAWENVFAERVRYSAFAMQFVLMFCVATLIALAGRLAFNISTAAIDVGIAKVQESLTKVIEFALRGEIVDSVNAALFAIMISLIIDAADHREIFDRVRWRLVLLMSIAMGLIAGVSRARLSLFADQSIDYLMFTKTAAAAAAPFLIGLVCGALVVMTLEDEMPKKQRKAPVTASPGLAAR